MSDRTDAIKMCVDARADLGLASTDASSERAHQPTTGVQPMTQTSFAVGDAVRISRDESIYAAKGTWSTHRSKPGFVVIINEGGGPLVDPEPEDLTQEEKDQLPRHPEYGVVLTTTHPQWRKEPGRKHELSYDSDAVLWFMPWELVAR